MPLPHVIADQLHVLEAEHRSVVAVSAPAYSQNVAAALAFIAICVVPTRAILASLGTMRDHITCIRALVGAPATHTRELEAARLHAVAGIGHLRGVLDSASPSVSAQVSRLDW